MHRLFSWLAKPKQMVISEQEMRAAHAEAQRLAELLHGLHRKVDQQRDDFEALKLKFESFQGRVYAWRRGGQPGIPPETPAELPLSDPRVSKDELRSRLLTPGKPFNHQP